MKELISNPPRYELEDGSIQVWRGMPKLSDVVQVMLENREKAYYEKERQRKKLEEYETYRLEKRRKAHPEEFFGWQDVVKEFKKRFKSIPDGEDNVSPVLLGLDGGERERELEEQRKKLLGGEDGSAKQRE